MMAPIRSRTPATPRSDEKKAKASKTNRNVISMVSVLRLINAFRGYQGDFVSAAAGFRCGSVIASTLLFSTNETRPLRRNQTPCASSHAASASTVEPSFILMIAYSLVVVCLLPVAIGPLLSAGGGGVAGAAGLGLGASAAGLAVSSGLGVGAGI